MVPFTWKPGETGWLEVSGKRLEAVCHGAPPSEAPTVVLLHEGLGCVGLWKDFPQRLAAATGFGVFAWSRAGYGNSAPADLPRAIDYMSVEATECLPQVLDAIGFRRGVLFGHSDGASIAAIHTGSIEDFRVRGLILVAPHFFTEPEGLASIAMAKDAYDNGSLREKLAKYHRHVDNCFRGWNDAWLNPDFSDWNIAEVIDYFRVPVLAVQGKDDQYGTLAQIHEIEKRIYSPVDVEILAQCKHSPHIEQPERLLEIVADFTARLERIEHASVEIR
ncbi:MAG: alpha/beta hydrolase [Rhizobiaceae bacterium]